MKHILLDHKSNLIPVLLNLIKEIQPLGDEKVD